MGFYLKECPEGTSEYLLSASGGALTIVKQTCGIVPDGTVQNYTG